MNRRKILLTILIVLLAGGGVYIFQSTILDSFSNLLSSSKKNVFKQDIKKIEDALNTSPTLLESEGFKDFSTLEKAGTPVVPVEVEKNIGRNNPFAPVATSTPQSPTQ